MPNGVFDNGLISSSYAISSKLAANNLAWSSTGTQIDLAKKISEFDSRLEKIEKMLMIINEREDLHAKYPALKNAFDEYKMIAELTKPQKEPK